MIVHKSNGWYLFSKDGSRKLGGPYSSKDGAIKRERQIQYFKHVKQAAFIKEAMLLEFSSHFWDRAFARPRVKNDRAYVEELFKSIGLPEDGIEDIPSLKGLLLEPNKKFLFQESSSKPKYIFAIKKNPTTGKHYFVAVTGLNPEHLSGNLKDITTLILQLSQRR